MSFTFSPEINPKSRVVGAEAGRCHMPICHVKNYIKCVFLSIFPYVWTKYGLLTSFTYRLTGLFAQRITCFPFMVYLISCIYDMTPLRLYVTCITIIDTIIHHILTNYTNDAYTYDTSPLRAGVRAPVDYYQQAVYDRGVVACED
jgi:hypothetical protein